MEMGEWNIQQEQEPEAQEQELPQEQEELPQPDMLMDWIEWVGSDSSVVMVLKACCWLMIRKETRAGKPRHLYMLCAASHNTYLSLSGQS
jgi:hypothetical protein